MLIRRDYGFKFQISFYFSIFWGNPDRETRYLRMGYGIITTCLFYSSVRGRKNILLLKFIPFTKALIKGTPIIG